MHRPHNKNKKRIYRKGKRVYVRFTKEDYVAPLLLVGTIGLSFGLDLGTDWREQIEVRAIESYAEQVLPVSTESIEISSGDLVTNKKSGQSSTGSSDEFSIEEIIENVFGEQAENAKKIAMCESGMNPETIGDTHIMGMLDGEMIGDSVGLFQIRTGDAGVYDKKPWNRAKANGMTVEEFRTWMKDPESNVKYAKTMFDREGWKVWWNCMNKTGVK